MFTDRQRVTAAFKTLEEQGYFIDMGNFCCGSCAGAELSHRMDAANIKPSQRKAVYFSEQNDAVAFGDDKGDTLQDALYMSWEGDPVTIADAMNREGLRVSTPASTSLVFMVLPPASSDHRYAPSHMRSLDCVTCGKQHE